MKRIGVGLVVAVFLVGLYTLVTFGLQLRTDYQNFQKIVVWVAQKQALEQRAAQQQQQRQQQAAAPAPAAQTPEK